MKQKITVEFSWYDVKKILLDKSSLLDASGTHYLVNPPDQASKGFEPFVVIIQEREIEDSD